MGVAVAYVLSFFLSVSPTDARYVNLEGGRSELVGKVLDGVTGEPINYANVILLPAQGAMPLVGGQYSITGIKPGIYRVKVIMPGYTTKFIAVYVPRRSRVVLDFRLWLAEPVIPDARSLPQTYEAGTK